MYKGNPSGNSGGFFLLYEVDYDAVHESDGLRQTVSYRDICEDMVQEVFRDGGIHGLDIFGEVKVFAFGECFNRSRIGLKVHFIDILFRYGLFNFSDFVIYLFDGVGYLALFQNIFCF